MTDTTTSPITDEQAALLAAHAIHVQGGYSTPENERERAEADLAKGGTIDWTKMQDEVNAALIAKVAAIPVTATHEDEVDASPVTHAQRVDVTAVLANVIAGEALRDSIKKMQAQLKVHEDSIKDVLGAAVEGTDSEGNIVVRFPFRNRSDLDRKLVKSMLSEDEYAKAVRETTYRTLLYGES